MNSINVFKCHKCRHILLDNSCVIDQSLTCDPKSCESWDLNKFIYINEDKAPTWIKDKVEEEHWTKGKLHCGKCNNRIGSFDYVSGRKCYCSACVLPPIHIVASQVDRPLKLNIT